MRPAVDCTRRTQRHAASPLRSVPSDGGQKGLASSRQLAAIQRTRRQSSSVSQGYQESMANLPPIPAGMCASVLADHGLCSSGRSGGPGGSGASHAVSQKGWRALRVHRHGAARVSVTHPSVACIRRSPRRRKGPRSTRGWWPDIRGLSNNGTASGDSELKTAGFGSHQDRLWHKENREALTYGYGLPASELPVRRRVGAARAALVVWVDSPGSFCSVVGRLARRPVLSAAGRAVLMGGIPGGPEDGASVGTGSGIAP